MLRKSLQVGLPGSNVPTKRPYSKPWRPIHAGASFHWSRHAHKVTEQLTQGRLYVVSSGQRSRGSARVGQAPGEVPEPIGVRLLRLVRGRASGNEELNLVALAVEPSELLTDIVRYALAHPVIAVPVLLGCGIRNARWCARLCSARFGNTSDCR
jgi:hypothetical protein